MMETFHPLDRTHLHSKTEATYGVKGNRLNCEQMASLIIRKEMWLHLFLGDRSRSSYIVHRRCKEML